MVIGIVLKFYKSRFSGTESGFYFFMDNYPIVALSVGLLGLLIRIITVGYSAENTSGRNTKKQVADSLNTMGIYSLTRNPLYLGNYLMWLSPALYVGDIEFIIIFSLLFKIFYERIIYTEENFLLKKFGDRYSIWAEKTPILLPKNINYKKVELSFNWKKILKKEKNGLFALFLIFLILEFVSHLQQGVLVIYNSWIFIGTVFSAVLYVILKILKYKTNML